MKTIEIKGFYRNEKRLINLTRSDIQRLIGVGNRGVFRKYLIACGHNPDDSNYRYNWKDVEMLCCLKLFLEAKRGRYRHTYYQFFQLREKGLIFQVCRMFKLRPRLLLEQIKNDYYTQSIAS
jgi:hypothetical protein